MRFIIRVIPLLCLLCLSWVASAQPIIYTISGLTTAGIDPNRDLSFPIGLSDAPFRIDLFGDTGEISNYSDLGLIEFSPADSHVIVGSYSGDFSFTTGLFGGNGGVSFYILNPYNTVYALGSPQLASYDFMSLPRPVQITDIVRNPEQRIQAILLDTTFGGLDLASISDVTFQAVYAFPSQSAAVPEPGSVGMLLAGASVVAFSLRRKFRP